MRGRRGLVRERTEDVERPPRWVGASEVRRRLPAVRAVDLLRSHLESDFSAENDGVRSRLTTEVGTLLQMPSTLSRPDGRTWTGTKILSLTPGNAEIGAPVIQGLYALFGGRAHEPLAIIDGAALTNVRTPAVSALGAQMLLDPARRDDAERGGSPLNCVIFGTGAQAWEHARTFAEVFALGRLTVVGRNPAKAEALARRAAHELNLEAQALATDGEGADDGVTEAVSAADLILTCTSSSTPLFRGEAVSDSAVVVAVGSHTPDARELDDTLMARAEVLVESRATATVEAGEVVHALESEAILSQYCLTTLSEMALFERQNFSRPGVFSTTGMPWEDLALAVGLGEEIGLGGEIGLSGEIGPGLAIGLGEAIGPGQAIGLGEADRDRESPRGQTVRGSIPQGSTPQGSTPQGPTPQGGSSAVGQADAGR